MANGHCSKPPLIPVFNDPTILHYVQVSIHPTRPILPISIQPQVFLRFLLGSHAIILPSNTTTITPFATFEDPRAARMLYVDARALEPGPRADDVVHHGEGHGAAVDQTRPVHGLRGQIGAPHGREAESGEDEEPPGAGDGVDRPGPSA